MIKISDQDWYTSIAVLSPVGSWNLFLLQMIQALKTLAHQWQSKATYWPLEIISLEMMKEFFLSMNIIICQNHGCRLVILFKMITVMRNLDLAWHGCMMMVS